MRHKTYSQNPVFPFMLLILLFFDLSGTAQKIYKPNLYIIAIGVSQYKNYPEDDLKYAHKDAKDLVNAFKRSDYFANVHSFLLINNLATRDTILKLKKELMKTDVDDYVILSFSGHGVLDKDTTFFFCTNNIECENLKTTAVNFDEMEGLLDSIPSRKKIFFIDACHSGEIDKEEITQSLNKSNAGKSLSIGNAKPFSPGNVMKIYRQPTFDLMNELFVDLRRRTGATVLASCSGVDLSFEKDQWNNGLFTYAVLSALAHPSKADKNGDGLFISELISYVINTVKQISQGYQVPTSREENIEFDYRIW